MTDPKRPDPLDPAERELADALARTLPQGGPGADIDAAILASARAAAAERHAGHDEATAPPGTGVATAMPASSAAGRPRHRRRSPAWLRGGALAASLVVAIGVVWQLRPRYEVPELADDLPEPAASVADAAPPPREAAPQAAPVESLDADTPLRKRSTEPLPALADVPEPAPARPPAPVEPPAHPAAPAPPAPPVEPAPAPLSTARPETRDAWLDQPLHDTPPASVGSPQVREAWLARIRELVAAGQLDEARASYEEFRRRHPDAPVPDDLSMLLDEE